MISLVVPAYSGGENLQRTIDSVAGVCDEAVVIATTLFDDDLDEIRKQADVVVEVPWNTVFLSGFGHLYNQASGRCKNKWQLLLGVAETFAEPFGDIRRAVESAEPHSIFRCNHHNDPNQWKRIWNPAGGTRWSGLIHEEIGGGADRGLLFRMQDTTKIPHSDALKNEAYKHIKGCSYNAMYKRLLDHPEELGFASPGWLEFVKGAMESIESYCVEHQDLIAPAMAGDKEAFILAVKERMSGGKRPYGVNFNPQGVKTSGNETITIE